MTETENVKQSTRYHVEGMDCSSCAIKIENVLKRVSGITDMHVNTGSGMVTLSGDFDRDAAGTAMGKLGYKVRRIKPKATHDEKDDHDHSHADPSEFNKPWWLTAKGKLVIVSATLVALSFIADKMFPALGMWPFIIATLVALYPVAKRAFAAARMGSVFTIEMLMTIAAVGALAIHAAEEAAVVVLLFAVGEVLEGVAASRARKSISALGKLAPKTALLIEGEQKKEVPVEALLPCQLVLVRPGDRIPCDGKIKEGVSEINEAPVTGESVPRPKAVDEEVFAGTINISAAITVEVTRAAADNTIARIIRLVDEAQSAKAPVQRFVDKFARIYMPIVVGIALLVAVVPPLAFDGAWDTWTYRALALLLIACPCALVISTPAAIAAGMSAGARCGLLIKGGVVLESLGALKTICFDKTGTLTEGKPKVTDLSLGIEARSELLPEDKARIVKELDASGQGPVGKVGDGVNDAPALAAASVGIAMGGGTDVALETADAALLNNSVMGVADLVKLSRATLANIRMNIILALGSKVIFLITTVLGITGMWIAVMADTGATVLVTINALRLLKHKN